jgi:SNF2 family DNA or RNA helicase
MERIVRNKTDLREYQNRIVTYLYEHNEALCVARMGGGKTISALTAIDELITDKIIRHALVIAPKRVANSVWPDEIQSWAHTSGLSYTLLTGNPAQRLQRLRMAHTTHITLVGIDLVGWLLEAIDPNPDNPIFDLLVIDEISKLRDPTGVRAKALAKNAPVWKMIWGLSGTLRPNSAMDLFMPARIVTRGKLWGRSFYKWRQEHFYPTDRNGYQWAALPGAEDRLNEQITPLTVTLRPEDMPQLPELSVILDYVDLPKDAQKAYIDMERKLVVQAMEKNVLAANAAVATGKLAQIANGFLYDDNDDNARATHQMHDEKRQWLEDIVEQAEGPTLLIYDYNEDLAMIREVVDPNVPFLGVNDAEDKTTIAKWNAGKLSFLALHPKSGGHGLNLQHGGCDMAWLAPTWSPELWEQTIARLHRPGQTKPVFVRVCVARRTVDEMKLARVHFKMKAQAAFEMYIAQAGYAKPSPS